jgi:hypothetical protein
MAVPVSVLLCVIQVPVAVVVLVYWAKGLLVQGALALAVIVANMVLDMAAVVVLAVLLEVLSVPLMVAMVVTAVLTVVAAVLAEITLVSYPLPTAAVPVPCVSFGLAQHVRSHLLVQETCNA